MANPFSPENFTQLSRVEFNETHRKPNEPLYLYVGRLKKILDTIPGSSTADQIFMISSKLPKRFNNRLLQLKIDTYEDFVIKVKAIEDEFQLEDAAKKKKKEEEAQKLSDPKSEPSIQNQNQNPKGKKAKKQQPNANLNSLEQSLNKLNLSDAISISINVNKSNEIITGGAQNPESDSNRKSGPNNNFNKQKNFNKKPNQNFQQQQNAPPNQFNKNRNAPNFQQKRGNYQGPPSGNLVQAKALSKSSVTLNLNANAPNNNKPKPTNFKGNKPGNPNFHNQGPKLTPMPIAQPSIYPNLSSPTPPPVQPNSLEVTLDHRLKITATLDPATALSSLSPRLAAQLGFILPGSGQEPYDHIDGRIYLSVDERNLYWIRVRIDDKSFHELTLGQDFLGCYRAV